MCSPGLVEVGQLFVLGVHDDVWNVQQGGQNVSMKSVRYDYATSLDKCQTLLGYQLGLDRYLKQGLGSKNCSLANDSKGPFTHTVASKMLSSKP